MKAPTAIAFTIAAELLLFPAQGDPSAVLRMEIVPTRISLRGSASRQRLLVNARYSDGRVEDVTRNVRFSSDCGAARVQEGGIVRPVKNGTAQITAKLGAHFAVTKVWVTNQTKPMSWSFENHIEPILSKQGCNMGPCHGASAGKGGFRLTLRGYDPDLDYDRIVREGKGRRIVIAAPESSLILKKPSLSAPHVGGLRLRRDSDEYGAIAGWIAQGAPGPESREPKVTSISVYPRERALIAGGAQQLLVTARYSDGRTEDVTHWARFTSNDDGAARVDDSGLVSMRSVGEAAISVWYQGKVAFSRLWVPFPNRVDTSLFDRARRSGFIDKHVYAKLEKLRIPPSPPSTDSEFIRRVYLDTIGALPTPDETRSFLSDSTPQKRERLIETLLTRPEYVDHWTYKLSDLFRVNRDLLSTKGMWGLHAWLRQSVAENKPWDQLARELLTAGGSSNGFGPAAFYRSGKTAEEYSETFSQTLLGIRVQCAKCHNHPFEKWTQSDYFRMANLFARVARRDDSTPVGPVFFDRASGDVNHPKFGRPLEPTPFDGPSLPLDSKVDRRSFLAKWLISPQNPYFARNIVNRIWKHYMGRGIVEPADDMRLTNPATNEPLLNALSSDFAKFGFDLRRLTGLILRSASYQTSSKPLAANAADDRYYSHYLVKRLTAETALDALCQVTGQPEKFPGVPVGARAASLPDTNIPSGFLDLFGRPVRQVTCDCERNMEPSVSQALHLISAEDFNRKVAAKSGVIDRLIDSGWDDRAILHELYLTCLSRNPSSNESVNLLAAIRLSMPHRRQALVDVLWALVSSPEFLFNH